MDHRGTSRRLPEVDFHLHGDIWRFPKSWGYPSSHPFIDGIIHYK